MQTLSFAPFQYPVYRNLWFASLLTNLGGLVQMVGAGWLMATLTDDPSMVALVQASVTAPIALLSLIAGVFADNYERRYVLIFAQTLMLTLSAILAGLTFLGLMGPWLLLAFTFSIACGQALHIPSWQASVGDLVPKVHIPQAVALNGMGFNLMRSTGPALGGAIVALFGPAMAFALNALSYAPVIAVLVRWRPERRPNALPRESMHSALRVGLRYATLSPEIMRILGRGLVFGLTAVSLIALMPLIARDLLEGTAVTFGILLASFGVGAVLVALSLARLRATLSDEWIVRLGLSLVAVGLFAASKSTNTALTALFTFVAGMGWQSSMPIFNISIQLATPRWVLGRILSVHQLATFGGMAVGALVWGRIANTAGLAPTLEIAAAACLLAALLGLVLGLPQIVDRDLSPSAGFVAPNPAIEMNMRSGPVKVIVEYCIADEDTREFLSLMAHRRIIRKRDGARTWALHRDLEHSEFWSESYQVANWSEYLRHHERRTNADAENYRAIRALHHGDEAPRARRWLERPADPKSGI